MSCISFFFVTLPLITKCKYVKRVGQVLPPVESCRQAHAPERYVGIW